jgi:GH24 family phage-related lysozyme (muramidase)
MSQALELFQGRVIAEEGERLQPYDDATGEPVKAPQGYLSWGWGFNLTQCGSHALFATMFRFLAGAIETQLQALTWYPGLPSGVQSVCLDIAYNGGVHDLLNYPHMIAALAARDYAGAAAQCTTKNPPLQSRYQKLAAIIAAGS